MVVVGDTGAQEELLPLLRRTRPDVVLLDCHPPKVAGLRACRLIKCLIPAPRVLIYSAYADERLGVAARVAGADGLLDKNSSALDLVQAIRGVHSGRRLLEPIEPGEVQDATRLLDRQEAQILEMLLDDVPPSEIAVALSMPPATVGRRVERHPGPPVRGAALDRGGHPVRPPCRVAPRCARPSQRGSPRATPAGVIGRLRKLRRASRRPRRSRYAAVRYRSTRQHDERAPCRVAGLEASSAP